MQYLASTAGANLRKTSFYAPTVKSSYTVRCSACVADVYFWTIGTQFLASTAGANLRKTSSYAPTVKNSYTGRCFACVADVFFTIEYASTAGAKTKGRLLTAYLSYLSKTTQTAEISLHSFKVQTDQISTNPHVYSRHHSITIQFNIINHTHYRQTHTNLYFTVFFTLNLPNFPSTLPNIFSDPIHQIKTQ